MKRLDLGFGLAILLVSLACIAFQLWLPTTATTSADYRAVDAVLAAEAKPGDAVLLYPWWTERARLELQTRLPIVGYLDSDAADLDSHPRIWVLAQPRLPRSSLARFLERFGPKRTALGGERTFGPLSLTLYTNGRYRPQAPGGAERLPAATAYLEAPDGSREQCTWDGRAHFCPNLRPVEVAWGEVYYAPYRCIVMSPPEGGRRLVLEFPAGAFSGTKQLRVRAGYIPGRGFAGGAASLATVRLESGAANRLTLPHDAEHLQHQELPYDGASAVRLSVEAQNPQRRELCVLLDAFLEAP